MQNQINKENPQESFTQWLRSPITEKQYRFGVHRDVFLNPYHGNKKKIHLRYINYRIGSDKNADIKIEDPFVSREHAYLELKSDGNYYIEDLNSKNGVFLNGTRVQKAKLPSQGVLRLGRSTISWKDSMIEAASEGELLVADPAMKDAITKLKSVARSPLPILLLGETGSGKEILAKLVHEWSARASGAFLAMNGALAAGGLVDSELFGHKKGAFTGSDSHRLGSLLQANHGTLFLDEVADIPLSTQVKLLRVLETGEVKALGADKAERSDFRLLCATSQNIESKIEKQEFRLDLYYRISGYVFRIPSLRERPADILLIARTLCEKKGIQLAANAEAKLLSHPWPGNIRELKSTLERAIVLCRGTAQSVIEGEHVEFSDASFLLQTNRAAETEGKSLEWMEKIFIQRSLERNGWQRSIAAQELGIARSTLFEKMKKYGIKDRI